MKNLKTGIGGAVMTLGAVLALCAATGTTAQAQYRQYPNDRDGYYRRDRNNDRSRRDRDRDRDRRDRDWRDERSGRNRDYGNGGYGNNGGYGSVYRAAQNQGYQNGLNTGASDADRGQSYNPQRSHFYKDAGRNNRQYAQAYRDGFLQGYDAGFRQYSRGRGRNDGYRRNQGGVFGDVLGGIFGRQ